MLEAKYESMVIGGVCFPRCKTCGALVDDTERAHTTWHEMLARTMLLLLAEDGSDE